MIMICPLCLGIMGIYGMSIIKDIQEEETVLYFINIKYCIHIINMTEQILLDR